MIVLAVHTTSPSLGVAITAGNEVITETVLPPAKEHLENLAPLVCESLASIALKPDDIDVFAAAIGPGSFSGIRIGLGLIKGMALGMGRPVVGLSSLELLARLGLEPGESGAAIIDARRNHVYMAVYERLDNDARVLWSSELVAKPLIYSKLTDLLQKPPIVVGEVVEGLTDNPDLQFRLTPHSPTECALLAGVRYDKGEAKNVFELNPLYIRVSDAEHKRIKK